MNKPKRNPESGYTLIGVLIVFIILAVLGTSIIMMTLTSLKTSSMERDNETAFYIAEAGLNAQMKTIEEEVQKIYNKDIIRNKTDFYRELAKDLPGEYHVDDFVKVNNIQPYTEIELSHIKDNEFYIKSIGYIDKESRTLESIFEVEWDEKENSEKLPSFAVLTNGQFTMRNGSIVGDIGTFLDKDGSIDFPGNSNVTVDGDIYVPNGNSDIVKGKGLINIPQYKAVDDYYFPELPPFPDIPKNYTKLPNQKHNGFEFIQNNKLMITSWQVEDFTFEVNENLEFSEININGNKTLTLDVGDTDREIVVDQLIVSGHIKLKGTGNLTIYIRDKISMSSGTTVNPDAEVNRLNIYYAGSNPIASGQYKLFGSLYAKDASITLGHGAGIVGNIFVGGSKNKLIFTGGSSTKSQLLFAPYSKIIFNAGGTFKGKIFSETFEISGGANVEIDNNIEITGPLSEKEIVNFNEENYNDTNSSFSIITQFIRETSN